MSSSIRRRDGESPSKKRKALHERVAQLLLDMEEPSPRPSRSASSNDAGASRGADTTCRASSTTTCTERRDEDANSRQASVVEKKSTVRKRRLAAVKSLYKLSNDRDNRIPLLCTSAVDVLPVLVACLQLPTDEQPTSKFHEDDAEIRRLASLTLNNLSTPMENKAVMVLGQHSNALVETLLRAIEMASPESHLCMICLYNLSYLEDGVDVLLNFCPGEEAGSYQSSVDGSSGQLTEGKVPDGNASFESSRSNNSSYKFSHGRHRHHRIGATAIPISPLQHGGAEMSCPALQNDHSLLRVLESIVRTYSPFLQSAVASVEREAIRWTLGMLCNVCKDPSKTQRIALILQTELIPCAVDNLKNTVRPMNQWTEKSMEEFTLILLCHLAKTEVGRAALNRLDVLDAIKPMIGKGGIHDHRAGVIRCALVRGEEENGEESKIGVTSPDVETSHTLAEF